MNKLLIDRLTETQEGLHLYQQERTIIEFTELISQLMNEEDVSGSELARRLKKTKGYVSQLLDGANMTIRTISDVFTVLGYQLTVTAIPLTVDWKSYDSELLDQWSNEGIQPQPPQ